MKGAKVEFGNKEKSSKKNVIQVFALFVLVILIKKKIERFEDHNSVNCFFAQVTSMQGTGYLLQTDDNIKIHDWYISLLHNSDLVVRMISVTNYGSENVFTL